MNMKIITTNEYIAQSLELHKNYNDCKSRFESRYIGESVYDSGYAGMDVDYFEVVITSINSDEMYIEGIDKSQNDKPVKLTYFTTTEELLAKGYKL